MTNKKIVIIGIACFSFFFCVGIAAALHYARMQIQEILVDAENILRQLTATHEKLLRFLGVKTL